MLFTFARLALRARVTGTFDKSEFVRTFQAFQHTDPPLINREIGVIISL